MSAKKITILAIGTRGDVQPAVALGKALAGAGHRVRILCGRGFAAWVQSHGLEAAPSQVDMQAVMESPAGRAWVANGLDLVKSARFGRYLVETYGWQIVTDSWEASRDADLIFSSFTSNTYAAAIAEKLDIPQIGMPLQPSVVATHCGWAVMNSPFGPGVRRANRWFGRLVLEPFPWTSYGATTNRLRREVLGLPAQTSAQYVAGHKQITVLHGYSPRVIPHPDDWPASYHTTGYWFLDESAGWSPPAGLQDFLTAGPPPLYIGFGSMTGEQGQVTAELIHAALRQTGQRAVLHTGWANLPAGLGEQVYPLAHAPHDWLFPRVAAVIHHGGAGTTAAGLRAGRPGLVIAHMADQPYWGQRVAALTGGPGPIPRPRLSAGSLAAAIRRLTEGPAAAQIAARAAALGEQLRQENGQAAALAILQPYLS